MYGTRSALRSAESLNRQRHLAMSASYLAQRDVRDARASFFAKQRVGNSRFGTKTAALVGALVASGYLMALAVGSSTLPWLAWISLLPLFLASKVGCRGFTALSATLCS